MVLCVGFERLVLVFYGENGWFVILGEELKGGGVRNEKLG